MSVDFRKISATANDLLKRADLLDTTLREVITRFLVTEGWEDDEIDKLRLWVADSASTGATWSAVGGDVFSITEGTAWGGFIVGYLACLNAQGVEE